MRKSFLEFCRQNLVLIDGAMGTEIYSHGYYINACYDDLNLSNPQLIKDIHQSYIDAGADVIETNTFGANRIKLQKHGLEHKFLEINTTGARIARETLAEIKMFIVGVQVSMPFGRPDYPLEVLKDIL